MPGRISERQRGRKILTGYIRQTGNKGYNSVNAGRGNVVDGEVRHQRQTTPKNANLSDPKKHNNTTKSPAKIRGILVEVLMM